MSPLLDPVPVAAVLVAAAVLLAGRPRTVLPDRSPSSEPGASGGRPGRGPARAAGRGRRVALAALAGAGAQLFVGGPLAPVAALLVGAGCWRVLGRVEPAAVRRARERAARDLPHLVGLMAAGLRAGAPPGQALAVACAALPGDAAEAFGPTGARLSLGVDPVVVWTELAGSGAGTAVLGRTLARAHHTGASVRGTVEALADQLSRESRAGTEDRARAVGVRAALPLGLCLLPAFLLLGIVPVVAGLAAQLGAR